jgi:microcystin degradation protein MlrC
MTVAVASIVQESNDFSPLRTHYEDLDFVFGKAVVERHQNALTEMGGFLSVLSQTRRKTIPLCAGWAVSGGRMLSRDFRRIRDEFTRQLMNLQRPEALLLALHGAQTADSEPDIAGALLAIARARLGPKVPIVATLDLHANITRRMISSATALIAYKTYPHIDLFETGQRAADLLLRILAGKMTPVMTYCKLPLIVPAENMQTTSGPFSNLMQHAEKLEQRMPNHYISILGVQPWLDVPEMGCSVIAVGSGDTKRLQHQVESLAQTFWNSRSQFDVELTDVEEAIREARRCEGPVVISEPSDSTGSGSPGDSTGVLKPLLDLCQDIPVAIFIVDPIVVRRAIAAGVGNTLKTSVGGRIGRRLSSSIFITARVRLVSDGRWTPQARGYSTGIETSMGRATVLEIGKIRLLVAERSTMMVDPELFRSHGIEPHRMQIIVVKSPNGFRAAYAAIAKRIFLVDTPGVSTPRLNTLPFRHVPRPIYPLDLETRFSGSSH